MLYAKNVETLLNTTYRGPINQAYIWSNIAASNGHKLAAEFLYNLEQIMSSKDIIQAQQYSKICVESGYIDC